MKIRCFQYEDQAAVIDLWERCRLVVPVNDPVTDIRLKMAWQPELFFVAEQDGKVVGSLMAGYDGHRGHFNYLAVLPELQGRGFGRVLVEHALEVLRGLGCPKVNLSVRETNTGVLAFYERLGFARDAVVPMGRRF